MDTNSFEPNLSSISENIIKQLAELGDRLEDPETGLTLEIESARITLPVELKVETEAAGSVVIAGSAPTQTVETTVVPVFHRMSLHLVATDGQ